MSIIGDGLWEDLENISLPSLPFQLQFPDIPLQCDDEADLLPILHLDPDFELSLDQSLVNVADTVRTEDKVIEDYVSRLEVSEQVSKLHVMVCGSCHSVFHFIDQFISHTHFCLVNNSDHHQDNFMTQDEDNSVEAIALLLWANTIIKCVREQMPRESNIEESVMRKRIKSKWFSLPVNFQMCWMKAAKSMMQIANISSYLQEQSHFIEPKLSESTCHTEPKKISTKEKSSKIFHSHRDIKGRWAPKERPAKCNQEYKCEKCQFTTNNEWKLTRHLSTKKHLDNIGSSEPLKDENGPCEDMQDQEEKTVLILEDEIEQFDKLANEKQFLYKSPCDIIMKDS